MPDFIDVTTMLALGRRLKESAEIAGVDLLRGKKVVAFGIGGAMATVARPVSAYQRRGADGHGLNIIVIVTYCRKIFLEIDQLLKKSL